MDRKQSSVSACVSLIVLGAVGTSACGGGALTHRFVDEPKGEAYEYGAPKNVQYSADVATARDQLRVTAYESAECDKILVKVMSRSEETLQDGEVIERKYVGPIQVADRTEDAVPCNFRFARGAEVSLKAGTATFRLGHADRFGELEVSLSEEMKQSLYGDQAPPTATLLVQRQPVADISMAELAKHEQRTAQLVVEFSALLAQSQMSPDDIARSYVLYEQLRQLDRGNAEVHGLCNRFLEIVYQRKVDEQLANMKKNIEALNSAKDLLLLAAAQSSVPSYVKVAIQNGEANVTVANWARGQVAVSVRSDPSLCSSGFSWDSVSGDSWPLPTRVALNYLRFSYNDPIAEEIRTLCSN